ncbi:hypothetical protein DFH09DRAFT_920188, partial [Mycena vulgaris]
LLQYLAPEEREHLRPRPCDVGSVHLVFTVDNIEKMLAGLLWSSCIFMRCEYHYGVHSSLEKPLAELGTRADAAALNACNLGA